MHFCIKCDNMYYLKISSEDSNNLIYYCRNCGYEDTDSSVDNICVSRTQVKRSEQKYSHVINEYTKQDPTLPRINTIKCPKIDCPSNIQEDKVSRDVIFIRYDDINMKYIYMCSKCDTIWKTDEQK
jgi:DNA-directed RNA polymerase subunit M/transcription elongation factor TFIIS